VEDTSSVHIPVDVRRRRHADRSVLRIPGVVILIVVSFAALAGFSGFESTFALFAGARLHLHLASTGVLFAIVGVVIVAVQGGLVRPAVRSLGEQRVLFAGLILNAVGLAILAAVHSFVLLAPAVLFLTVGQGLASPTLSSALAGKVGPERRGGLLGLQQSAGGLARVAGPIGAGPLFQHIGVAAPYLTGAVIMCAAAIGLATARHTALGPRGGDVAPERASEARPG